MNIAGIFDNYYNGEKNFFTPRVYGYEHKLINEDYELVIEKSRGTGLFDQPLYGCTVLVIHKQKQTVQQIELSKAFNSPKEVNDYIKNITVEDVIEAEIFGEEKKVI